ncbi:MAG: ABC transporter ATP-binding protein [Pseudomonadota bacterium]|jgi:peptide/nickel transport system ATP-binding protein
MSTTPILSYRELSVAYRAVGGSVEAVRAVTFDVEPRQSFGLVGESGCGKSTLAMATMGYLGDSGFISHGSVSLLGKDLVGMDAGALRAVRGSQIAMVYQDPMASLNPAMTIGRQLTEGPVRHGLFARREAREQAIEMLRGVRLADAERMLDRYPHQLSGGQQQRVVIAMALIARPKLILLDEPTTGLDVTVEAAVLDLIASLKERFGVTLLYISHNLGLVAQVCDRVAIMYGGEIVEIGSVDDIFKNPRHPYTRALLACLPGAGETRRRLPALPGQIPSPGAAIPGCVFGPRCGEFHAGLCDSRPITLERPFLGDHAVRCVRSRAISGAMPASSPAPLRRVPPSSPLVGIEGVSKTYVSAKGPFGLKPAYRTVNANAGLDFEANRSEVLAIVGESGSGKSTFAKILTGLETADEGKIIIGGNDIARTPARRRSRALLKTFQMVFQNPDDTLNPSFSVAAALRRSLKKAGVPRRDLARRVHELLAVVRLPQELGDRRPYRLSGGQKQRVAIARALAAGPSVLVCDEPVSALDVSVQAAITNLLLDVQDSNAMTIILISHDLGLVQHMADRVVVMYAGHVVQFGAARDVYSRPQHPYTEVLLSARLNPDPRRPTHAIPMARRESPAPGKGCCFAARCPRYIGPVCDAEAPPPRPASDRNVFYCHWSPADLARPLPAMPASGSP